MFLEIEDRESIEYLKYSNLSSRITRHQVDIELEILGSIMNQDI